MSRGQEISRTKAGAAYWKHVLCTYTNIYIYIYVRYIYIYIYMLDIYIYYLYIYVRYDIYLYICMYTCTYIYVHLHIQILYRSGIWSCGCFLISGTKQKQLIQQSWETEQKTGWNSFFWNPTMVFFGKRKISAIAHWRNNNMSFPFLVDPTVHGS